MKLMNETSACQSEVPNHPIVQYSETMKNITTVYLLAASFVLIGCGSESPAPNTPVFTPPETADDAQAEDRASDDTSSSTTGQSDTQIQDGGIIEPGDVEGPGEDVSQPSDGIADGESSNDTAATEDISEDVSTASDSSSQPDDAFSETPDAAPVPDILDDDDAGADTAQPEVDAEEPGECEVDSDCLLLTKKTCCPEVNVCAPVPEAGTLNEEVEALAWLSDNCLGPADNECPELSAPECSNCIELFAYAPVCDKEIGECVLDKEPLCEAYCEAIAIDPNESCPFLSAPDEVDGEAFSSCVCP